MSDTETEGVKLDLFAVLIAVMICTLVVGAFIYSHEEYHYVSRIWLVTAAVMSGQLSTYISTGTFPMPYSS